MVGRDIEPDVLAAPWMILDRGYRVGSVLFLETSYDDPNDGAVAAVHESAFWHETDLTGSPDEVRS